MEIVSRRIFKICRFASMCKDSRAFDYDCLKEWEAELQILRFTSCHGVAGRGATCLGHIAQRRVIG